MNILLINPPNNPYTEKSLLIEPVDILTLAEYIKELGNNINFIDMDLKQMDIDSLKKYIETQTTPDTVIISYDYHIPLHTSKTIEIIKDMCNSLKNFGIKIILIGKTISYSQDFAESLNFDIGIIGETELTLKELLKLETWDKKTLSNVKGIIYKLNGDIIKNPYREEKINLYCLPIIDRNLVDLKDYIDVRSMLTSRGCINKCDFCPTFNFWGKWRGKIAIQVVAEIEELIKKHNAEKIMFLDDNMTVDKQRMKEISKLIIEKKLKAKFGCLSSINNFDEETFVEMYNAGFRWVHFGVETGSQKVLENNNKHFSVDYAKSVILKVKQIGYRVRTSFIFDLPTTEKQDMLDTINFILETEPDEVRGHFLALRLGTKVYEQSSKKGKLTSQYIHRNVPEFETENYSSEELMQDVDFLTEKLKQRNYTIVNDVTKWNDINSIRNAEGKIKFLSFCPSRYGIDWEII